MLFAILEEYGRANFGVQHIQANKKKVQKPQKINISGKHSSILSADNVTPCTSKRKFLDTLVFNHLPPSDHERKTSQSIILRFKTIEQGQLLYPKISPLIFIQDILKRSLNAQGCSRIDPTNTSPKKWIHN